MSDVRVSDIRNLQTAARAIIALALLGAAALAGPLTPPAGPVTSTGKPLSDVEPRIAINSTNTLGDANSLFRISTPGSYYLTGNITGVSGKSGIEIASSNVTLDLMGFDVRGVAGALQGIVSSGSITNVVIRNGSVGGWPSGGVIISPNGVFACIGIRADSNTGTGISFDTGLIEDCTASFNTGIGIRLGQGGVINRCFAKSNGSIGIDAGIIASVTQCSAVSNASHGIQANGNSVVAQCTSQQNVGAGFVIGFATLLTDSVSRGNSGVGVDAKGGSSVRGCTVDDNDQDGILVQTRSLILNNSVSVNGADTATIGAGIRATGVDNRIEGNNCVQNDRGIQIDSAGNLIFSNSCSGNRLTNFEFVANNVYGPIIDRRAPDSAAVSGSSAASTLGSTDPLANYAY